MNLVREGKGRKEVKIRQGGMQREKWGEITGIINVKLQKQMN